MAVLVSRSKGADNLPYFLVRVSGEELNTLGYLVDQEDSKITQDTTERYNTTIREMNDFFCSCGCGENW